MVPLLLTVARIARSVLSKQARHHKCRRTTSRKIMAALSKCRRYGNGIELMICRERRRPVATGTWLAAIKRAARLLRHRISRQQQQGGHGHSPQRRHCQPRDESVRFRLARGARIRVGFETITFQRKPRKYCKSSTTYKARHDEPALCRMLEVSTRASGHPNTKGPKRRGDLLCVV